jgi:RNA 2',3'-cyclic 3'-phosphodiesterase
VRCFIAIDLSDEVRSALDSAQGRLRARAPAADVRWVDPAGMHLTLQFLGEVSERRLADVRSALATAATTVSPMALACRGLGAFPGLTRPRVVWAGIHGAVGDLSRLAAACQPLGFVPEKRSFRGHVTLGRVRSPRGFAPLARVIEAAADDEFGAWTAAEVVLYRSHLRRTGSVYEPLHRVPLGHAAG